jgi:hypothetical protein
VHFDFSLLKKKIKRVFYHSALCFLVFLFKITTTNTKMTQQQPAYKSSKTYAQFIKGYTSIAETEDKKEDIAKNKFFASQRNDREEYAYYLFLFKDALDRKVPSVTFWNNAFNNSRIWDFALEDFKASLDSNGVKYEFKYDPDDEPDDGKYFCHPTWCFKFFHESEEPKILSKKQKH